MKEAIFERDGYEYVCTISETRGAVAPYRIDVLEGKDELHLDSDFKSWDEDVYGNFESLIQEKRIQDKIIKSNWWEYAE